MAQCRRKRRTREHIIADLSFNKIEYFTLKAGFTLEKFGADYGYDAELYTYRTYALMVQLFDFMGFKNGECSTGELNKSLN